MNTIHKHFTLGKYTASDGRFYYSVYILIVVITFNEIKILIIIKILLRNND